MPKISIIMPVYKVEKYVAKTIESVLKQTFTDFEFFAIDDGSPDNSGKICDEYAKKDSRVIVIHKKNGGAPEARNVAIEKATGKYMYFIDSDDWIESEMLEKMYNAAEENEADLVITGFCMEYYENGKYVTYKNKILNETYENKEMFRKNAYKYFNNSILSLPWNKLYLSERIKKEKIRFPNTKWDDHHFNMDYLMNTNKVVMLSIEMYHWYRSREGSETMINYSDPNMYEKRLEHYQHIKKLYKYWNLEDENSIDAISSYYVGRLFQCVQELTDNSTLSFRQKIYKVKKILNDEETINALKNAKNLSKKMKILVMPMRHKKILMSLLFGKSVSIIRNVFPSVFIRMKEKEVHMA